MKIHIRRIRPEGMELDESFPAETIGLTQKDALRFVSPVEIKTKITRADNGVFAKITAGSRYESLCGRCLEGMTQDWTTEFTLSFDVEKGEEFIEMGEDIRQELILNLPARVLCQADCKGLCIDCGANLNKQECKHKHAVISGK